MNDKPQVKVGAQTLALVANMAATIFAARTTQTESALNEEHRYLVVQSVGAAFEIMKEVSRQEQNFNEWLASQT